MPFKFTYVCDLLERLETLEIRDAPLLPADKKSRYFGIIDTWFKNHRKLIDASDTDRAALLSTFFPERRTDRVYFLKEQGLVKILGRCLGLGRERLQVLENWKSSDSEDLATLISNIQLVTDAGLPSRFITVEQVDVTLTQLAARCRFSSPHVRAGGQEKSGVATVKESPEILLRPFLTGLSSRDLKWFIRLILKRFNPVTLDENAVLRSVHFLLPRILKFQSTFEAAIQIIEHCATVNAGATSAGSDPKEFINKITSQYLRPQTGVKVGRPEFVKARSIKHCLNICSRGRWAIEPKYDGEYCQLHIDLSKGAKSIQIFSKSGKDSTKDRRLMHDWIKACLQIGEPDCKFKNKCILEGEMVVYNEKSKSILEFHKIRKYVSRSGSYMGTEADSPQQPDEHLMMVFYDALLIDDDIVMAQPYETRRRRLRDLMHYYPGWCQTADWGILDLGKTSRSKAIKAIDKAFAKAITLRCEGLLLKPCDQPYFSLDDGPGAGKFVKLKKDYIPGLGDTADFAIVGASFNAAEVPPEARNVKWTNFTIACLENKERVCRYQERPTFKVMGDLARPCIPIPDLIFLSDHGQFTCESYDPTASPANYDLVRDRSDSSIQVTFKKPFIVEVLGSSFDKPSSKNHYMLRHPRTLKVYRDRGYEDVVSFSELQEMAYQARTLPEDSIREEAEWLHRIKETHSPRDIYSMSTASQTTTTVSPGSKRSSPAKSPFRAAPIPFVRIDSSELLPGENNPNSSTVVRQEKISCDISTAMLPTPPTSSAAVPTSSTLKAPTIVVQPLASSLKRKRHTLDLDVDRANLRNITNLSQVAASVPLADITNSPPKRDPGCRSVTNSRMVANTRICKVVHFAADMQENSSGRARKHVKDAASPVISHAARPTTPGTKHAADPWVARLENTQQRLSPITTGGGTCKSMTKGTRVASIETFPILQVLASRSAAAQVQEDHTKSKRFPAASLKQSGCSTPFTKSTLYLSPCVAAVPYLTQDLLPRLFDSSASSSDLGFVASNPLISTSLSHWVRAVQNLPPISAVVSESQAFVGMQKVVLVESRRKVQTTGVIDRILKEVNLVNGEVVDVWDWRAVEEVADVIHSSRSSSVADQPGSNGAPNLALVSQTEATRNDKLEMSISIALEQADLEDRNEFMIDILQRWYLGCVSWCKETGRNAWAPATEEVKMQRPSIMTMTDD